MSIVGLILLFPLFNVESDFSLTFGGLILNGTATYIVLRYLARRYGWNVDNLDLDPEGAGQHLDRLAGGQRVLVADI